jgi:hypothetical protein
MVKLLRRRKSKRLHQLVEVEEDNWFELHLTFLLQMMTREINVENV